MADFYDRHIGGLIPLCEAERVVHVVDGVTHTLSVTWLRRRIEISHWGPRWVRRG